MVVGLAALLASAMRGAQARGARSEAASGLRTVAGQARCVHSERGMEDLRAGKICSTIYRQSQWKHKKVTHLLLAPTPLLLLPPPLLPTPPRGHRAAPPARL